MEKKILLPPTERAISESLKKPFLLQDTPSYLNWRTEKLAEYPTNIKNLIVPIKNPYQLTSSERFNLIELCRKFNFVVYQLPALMEIEKMALVTLAAQLGLTRIDRTLCTEEDGITALQVATSGQSQDYIPYTDKPINWHTDGYYNAPHQQVHALMMHCVRPALSGGENMLLDHEIAYLQLRDNNPHYIEALMEDDVMTIPANVQNGVELRPQCSGPVFSVKQDVLHMRYTARARNIVWKNSAIVREALSNLTHLFNEHSPYLFHYRLAANQGVICNNVLHNRTKFFEGETLAEQRLLYRIRFYDRVSVA
ncbi:MAG: hypothetical protein BWK79_03290 [Beggiatoa sp. IS2]|nr:MAG: hypothetical protein BWK79_03290 [Beggiatoa sp. IS2]